MKKKIIIIISIFILSWLIMFTTDFILYKNNLNPIFCISTRKIWSTPNYSAFGFGYRINAYYQFDTKKMEFGTYSMLFNPGKYFTLIPLNEPYL